MKVSSVRMIHPAILVGAFAVKKLTVFKAAQSYGWPRVYRRIVEGIRATLPKSDQEGVQNSIKSAFRLPDKAVTLVTDSGVLNFAKKFSKYIVDKSPVNLPPFMVSLAKTILSENPLVRMWGLLKK
jgi:hypothetical protein